MCLPNHKERDLFRPGHICGDQHGDMLFATLSADTSPFVHDGLIWLKLTKQRCIVSVRNITWRVAVKELPQGAAFPRRACVGVLFLCLTRYFAEDNVMPFPKATKPSLRGDEVSDVQVLGEIGRLCHDQGSAQSEVLASHFFDPHNHSAHKSGYLAMRSLFRLLEISSAWYAS